MGADYAIISDAILEATPERIMPKSAECLCGPQRFLYLLFLKNSDIL